MRALVILTLSAGFLALVVAAAIHAPGQKGLSMSNNSKAHQ